MGMGLGQQYRLYMLLLVAESVAQVDQIGGHLVERLQGRGWG